MGNLPIPGLPSLTATTNNSLLVVSASGTTYNISALNFWKSPVFGKMYQDLIPDAPSAHTIGSLAYPLKSVYVSTGSVFIGPNNSLAINNNGVLYSTNVFAAPTFQVGNITSSGQVVTTSGVTFSVLNNEMLMISNSGGTVTNLTRQPVPTGGTINQVLTQTGNSNYNFGWVTPTQLVPTGGTINQVLTQTGNTNNDLGWVSNIILQNLTLNNTNGDAYMDFTENGIVYYDGNQNILLQIVNNNGIGEIIFGGGSQSITINDGLFVDGVAYNAQSSAWIPLAYNTSTKEIGYGNLVPAQVPTRYYGAFSSTVSQVSSGANLINAMSANTTEHSVGVVLSANTRFVMSNAGAYNIQFSAQLQQQQNVDSKISIWFRKNGTDITNSNTEIEIEKNGAGNSKMVAAWNYVDTFNANDYFQIMWSSPDNTMELLYQGTQTVPVRPATPSLIVTVTQV